MRCERRTVLRAIARPQWSKRLIAFPLVHPAVPARAVHDGRAIPTQWLRGVLRNRIIAFR